MLDLGSIGDVAEAAAPCEDFELAVRFGTDSDGTMARHVVVSAKLVVPDQSEPVTYWRSVSFGAKADDTVLAEVKRVHMDALAHERTKTAADMRALARAQQSGG